MKGTKLLLAFWLSTAAFCLLQILFGPSGLTETARLRDQQARLSVRLEELKEENQALSARYEALRTSPEAVWLEARSLGWFRVGEIPVRTLDGADFRLPSDEPDLSTVPRMIQENTDLTFFFRVAWFLLFASFYALLYLSERLWMPSSRWEQVLRAAGRTFPSLSPPD